MAKLSDLISCSSKVTGVPEPTVREISRRLREAHLIRTGFGGRYGGADMTPEDAATLLTGILIVRASAVSLSKIVLATKSYLRKFRAYSTSTERLPLGRWDRKLQLPQLYRLKTGHRFGEAFTALIASIMDGDFERALARWGSSSRTGGSRFFAIEVRIDSLRPHPEAWIQFDSSAFRELKLVYLNPRDAKNLIEPQKPRNLSDLSYDTGFDLTVKATLGEQTLTSVARLLSNSEMKDG
jgi:hypothetical protein